jgi:valyl-tRNA synthetase
MAARIYRRSGVLIDVEGDARRIFENVVRPKEDGQGDVEAEVGRLRREIARAEKMLANERFVSNAPPDVVEAEQTKLAQYQAELAALGG